MKMLMVVLTVLLILMQYKLWYADGGVGHVWNLKQQVNAQVTANNKQKDRNKALEAEVKDLKQGKTAIEERARNELGMIRKDEIFYQIVE